ncbi:M23 family metallopeptidase [Patescibacteria group bacterium]|nr:M23 family metallopeptidase [Patescibacteria group bacterium]
MPSLEDIKKARKGSKISRFFRHVFEHRSVKKLLGANLAMGIILSSFLPIKTIDTTAPDSAVIQENIAPLTTERKIQTPVKEFMISQGFSFFHPGVDLAGNLGEPVYPIMGGVIEAVDHSRYGYGNAIIIGHGNEITSLYAHLSEIEVAEGQYVTTIIEVGKMGATGHATGPHVHLEVRQNGIPMNPWAIVPMP